MSRILVDQIRSNSASGDAITLDGNGKCAISATTINSLTFPTADGSANQVLKLTVLVLYLLVLMLEVKFFKLNLLILLLNLHITQIVELVLFLQISLLTLHQLLQVQKYM